MVDRLKNGSRNLRGQKVLVTFTGTIITHVGHDRWVIEIPEIPRGRMVLDSSRFTVVGSPPQNRWWSWWDWLRALGHRV